MCSGCIDHNGGAGQTRADPDYYLLNRESAVTTANESRVVGTIQEGSQEPYAVFQPH